MRSLAVSSWSNDVVWSTGSSDGEHQGDVVVADDLGLVGVDLGGDGYRRPALPDVRRALGLEVGLTLGLGLDVLDPQRRGRAGGVDGNVGRPATRGNRGL